MQGAISIGSDRSAIRTDRIESYKHRGKVDSLDKIQPEAQIPSQSPEPTDELGVTGDVGWLGISKSGQAVTFPRDSLVSQEVRMKTAIGFDLRDRAEEVLEDLLRQSVLRESIVFLTRSETDLATSATSARRRAAGIGTG